MPNIITPMPGIMIMKVMIIRMNMAMITTTRMITSMNMLTASAITDTAKFSRARRWRR
jgi:hypothetical protein